MHELGIAQQLIETAVALMPPDTTRISRLRVQVGALAGVSANELRFGFEAVRLETPCAEAELQLEIVPAVAHCPQCSADFAVHTIDDLLCPTCGSNALNVVQGKELIIASLDVISDDEEDDNVAPIAMSNEASNA